MLQHTFKPILRSLWRHKRFTSINLLGLSLGFAAVVLIHLIARYEKSFDSFHSNAEELYRVVSKTDRSDGLDFSATVPYPTGRYLQAEYAGFKATQIHFEDDVQIRLGEEPPFVEENVVFADSLFFQVLDFAGIDNFWLAGNPATALNGPGQVLLTESKASQFFGSENPMGKLIRLDNKVDVVVVGVIKDAPRANHLPFSMIVSFSTLTPQFLGLDFNTWDFTSDGYTYVRVPNSSAKTVAQKALQEAILRNRGVEAAGKKQLYLQPLEEIHFDLAFESSNTSYTISPRYLSMLLLLGGFIMLIACVNYVNLSTSFAFTKSKEVGIRKTIGASRKQLFYHYMLETLLLSLCAAGLGIVLSLLLLPGLNSMLNKHIAADALLNPAFIAGALFAILIIALLSGAYPALVLSGFNPISSLKNQQLMPGKSSALLRKALVVFQFTISTVLIICTLVIARQMEYFQNKELGFRKDAVVEVGLPESDSVKIEKFRSLLQSQAGVENISFCLGAPISDNALGVSFKAPELAENIKYSTRVIPCDKNYADTYGLQLLAGRWFLPSEELKRGTAVVVNRSLAKTMGYANPADALGKSLTLGLDDMNPMIVGVTEDFHTSSLHENISPVALTPFPYFYYAAGIRLSPGTMRNNLAAVEKAWRQVYPNNVFALSFVDETLARSYQQEHQNYQLFKVFSIVSIFICCIGLWGLIAFVVVRKTKEIGIRKVLGASVGGIVLLLSRDFLRLVLLALLIASPIAWYFMEGWLQDFAYRISISWWIFALAGLAALLIAFFTISFQAFRAARVNPVKNLRAE